MDDGEGGRRMHFDGFGWGVVFVDVVEIADGVGGGRRSFGACVGGAVANDGLVVTIVLTSKLLLGLGNIEYIEVSFTVLLVCSSPVIVSLEVLFALVASMFVLRANWLSLLSKFGKVSVIKLFACVAVVLLVASSLSKMLHWNKLWLQFVP